MYQVEVGLAYDLCHAPHVEIECHTLAALYSDAGNGRLNFDAGGNVKYLDFVYFQ